MDISLTRNTNTNIQEIHSFSSQFYRTNPSSLFFQGIKNKSPVSRADTRYYVYWPRLKKKKKKKQFPQIGRGIGRFGINWHPGKKRKTLLTRRWETASVNGAIVNRFQVGLSTASSRFSDRQSSETWAVTVYAGFIDRRPAPGKRKYRWPGKFVVDRALPRFPLPLDIGLHSLPRRLIESRLPAFLEEKKKRRKEACVKNRGEIAQRVVFARFLVFMDVVFYGGFL